MLGSPPRANRQELVNAHHGMLAKVDASLRLHRCGVCTHDRCWELASLARFRKGHVLIADDERMSRVYETPQPGFHR